MSMTIDAAHLRLFSPESCEQGVDSPAELRVWSGANGIGLLALEDDGEEEMPLVFPFPTKGALPLPRTQEQLLARMKTVHRNRTCRSCQSSSVVPLQKTDDLLNRNRMPIPGTATLVGFQCSQCSAEWSL